MVLRKVVPSLTGASMVAGVAISLALPMYTCEWGRIEEIQAVGDPEIEITCLQSDLGYRPSSWLPTKIAVAAGGGVLAIAILLVARRRVLAACALLVLFVAITSAWFLPNGFEQPIRAGQPVCCGREVDRHDVRVGVVSLGTVAAIALLATDLSRTYRPAVA